MKKVTHLLSGLFLVGTITTTAQISTGTGGAANVLANSPTTNTNVGIGTNNPTAKLEVIGTVKAIQGLFSKPLPNGSVFTDWADRNEKCVVLTAGSIIGTSPGLVNTRMFNFFDFPQSNIDAKSMVFLGIEDRNDFGRYRFIAETGGYTEMSMRGKTQEEILKLNDDGNDKVFMHLPKPNSRIVIGGWGDYLPEHKFVVRGSAKIEGNILTDANIGIGTSNFVDGADTYRLSVKGKIRAEEIKVYNTWADYVFTKEYPLPTLQEVERYIATNGHLQNVPSAKEVTKKGLSLGEMAKIQQEKIEELMLYIIAQNKRIEALEQKMQ